MWRFNHYYVLILKHRKKFKNSFNKSLNIFLDMKKNSFTYWIVSLALLFNVSAFAQYDDVYYNPDTDGDYYETNDYDEDTYTEEGNSSSDADEYAYDDDSFDDFNRRNDRDRFDRYDDDGYYYSSRIRRFNRPYYGFNYYDPVYVDSYYYGNGYNPYFNNFGTTVLIYSNNNSYRNWRRANRFNRWNRFSPYRRAYGFNNYGYGFNSPYGRTFNGFGGYGNGFSNNFGGGYVSNAYCPPSYGNGLNYNTRTNNRTTGSGNYYGSRRSGDVRNTTNTGVLGRGNGSASSNTGRGTTSRGSTSTNTGTRGTNRGRKNSTNYSSRSSDSKTYRGTRSAKSGSSYKSNRRSSTLNRSSRGSSSSRSYKPSRSSSRSSYSKPSRSYNKSSRSSSRSSSRGSSSFKSGRGN